MTDRSDFYAIREQPDGTVDVYLRPPIWLRSTDDDDCDADLCVVRGVEPYANLATDVRKRFLDWCMAGEMIEA